ncbi:MAG: GAF domain-containing protein [Chloroflexi bacterium]|nr:GAF domain-containing protein [Chloroflexota bacterium]
MQTTYPRAFFRKLAWATTFILVGALFLIRWLPLPESRSWAAVGVVLLFAGLTWARLKWFLPRFWQTSWLRFASISADTLVVAAFDYLLGSVDLSPFYIVIIIISAMVWTRDAALFAAALASSAEFVVLLAMTPRPGVEVSQVLIRSVVFVATAVLVSELAAELGARWRAIAAESEQQRQEIEEQRDELEGLNEIAQSFGNLEDLRETFRQVTERIAHLLGAELCVLTRFDERTRTVRGMPPGYGLTDEHVARIEYQVNAEILSIWDISRRKYLILNDPARLPAPIANIVVPIHLRQIVAARLMRRGRPIGLIFAANRIKSGGFEEKDAQLLSILAGQAAIAIENARLYANAQENLRNVTRLYALSSQLSARSDPNKIPARVVSAVAEALNAPTASMALLNPATGQLSYAATLGLPPEVTKLEFREQGVAMTVLRTSEPRFIEDVELAGDVNPVTRSWGFRATACLPIQLGGKPLGVLYVNYSEPHTFTDVEKNVLAIFANQAATALENARLHQVEKRQAAELETLAKLSHSLAETMDLEEMFRVIEREIRAALPLADAGTLLIFDPVHQVLQPRAAFGSKRKQLFKLKLELDEAIAGQAFGSNQSLAFSGSDTIREIRQRTMRLESQEILAAAAYGDVYPQNAMAVVVATSSEKIGVLLLENYHSPEAFTADDLQLLEAMADRVALAIRNAQLYARGLRRATQLAAVAEATRRVAAILDMDELLPTVAQMIHTQFAYRYVHLFINDPGARLAVYRAGAGPAAETMAQARVTVDFGVGIIGQVAETGQLLLANDVTQDAHFVSHEFLPETRSELAVPLRAGTRVIGLLDAQSERVNAFDESDVVTLQTLAGQIAIAIENAELYGEMQEQARRDSLTQAYTHGYFLARLNAEVEKAARENGCLSLIMLDVDYFKDYNDRYGHVVGDQVLGEIIRAITRHVHKTDLVGRWGGEEFSIALLGTDSTVACAIANRIRETLATARLVTKSGLLIQPPTISQGLATFPDDARDTPTLIDLADAALYAAKARGRNQILCGDERV